MAHGSSPWWDGEQRGVPPPYCPRANRPPLNIVIQIIGSRGDIQPFIAIGTALKSAGHRVRLATHSQFKGFVFDAGLEFFDVGGDPADLMAFMVESPSLIPSVEHIRKGAIQRKRAMYEKMLNGFWQSCTAADRDTNIPFVADAIIANPPSFAHVHCAQALGIPVHLMFTMPWSSTKEFPHPLATVDISKLDWEKANYASYVAVEMLIWQGLGDIVNNWRVSSLGLEPVPGLEGHRLLEVLGVPVTYCWSPSLVAKPEDWGSNIDVCGFIFREQPSFEPPQELQEFLQSGPPPIYVGCGSIVTRSGGGMLRTILNAIQTASVRAIISKGWSNLDGSNSEGVFYIGDCPHEWLFQQVAAVVHHGGAGTTACGLRNGRPTVIIPFFGDQPFWGNVIARSGAGPAPIPFKSLTSQNLAQAIEYCLQPSTMQAAQRVAEAMQMEDGVKVAVQSFHAHLPQDLACDFHPDQPASLEYVKGKRRVKMCKPVASVLLKYHRITLEDLNIYRSNPIAIENLRWDPVTALSAATLSTLLGLIEDTASLAIKPFQLLNEDETPLKDGDASLLHVRPKSDAPSFAMLPLQDASSPPLLVGSLEARSVGSQQTYSSDPTALAILSGIGKLASNTTKGVLVDVPLALTEGLRAVPRLYHAPLPKHGAVSDVRSGLSVAGKTFSEGMAASVTDIFTYTYHGKKEHGAGGAAKGLGKGLASLIMKSSSATLGLFSFPAQGVYRSLWRATHKAPIGLMVASKIEQGDWEVSVTPRWNDCEAILQDLDGLLGIR